MWISYLNLIHIFSFSLKRHSSLAKSHDDVSLEIRRSPKHTLVENAHSRNSMAHHGIQIVHTDLVWINRFALFFRFFTRARGVSFVCQLSSTGQRTVQSSLPVLLSSLSNESKSSRTAEPLVWEQPSNDFLPRQHKSTTPRAEREKLFELSERPS